VFFPIGRFHPKELIVRRALLAVVLAFATSVAGLGTFSAGAAAGATPFETCASKAIGPVSDALKRVVCAEFVADLAGIGKLLGLPPWP
jgi:hypothetical protein